MVVCVGIFYCSFPFSCVNVSEGSLVGLLEVVVRGSLFEQKTVNRFTYLSDDAAVSVDQSFALSRAFGLPPASGLFPADTPLQEWQALVNQAFKFLVVQVRLLYSPTDFYEAVLTSGIDGDNTAQTLAPFNAFGLYTNRVRTDVARGTKRFAGVGEDASDGSGLLVVGYQNLLQTVADSLSETLTYNDGSATIEFTPCVLGKESYITGTGRTAYRYFATEAEQLDHTAVPVEWAIYPTVRSQVSRQFGRGI